MAERTEDWDRVAAELKRKIVEGGGFYTIEKDTLRELFGIGRLAEGISEKLSAWLEDNGVGTYPHPYDAARSLRLYDMGGELWRIGMAFADPDNANERPLKEVANLYARDRAAKDKRSDDVPWIHALDVFLQLVIGRPPEGWEDLDDDRETFELLLQLAGSLELPEGAVDAPETKRLAGSVCAFRPRRLKWEGAEDRIATALAEADRKQKEIFDAVLREAAQHLLGEREVPSRPVELGRLGLRYRREAQGGFGWMR